MKFIFLNQQILRDRMIDQLYDEVNSKIILRVFENTHDQLGTQVSTLVNVKVCSQIRGCINNQMFRRV